MELMEGKMARTLDLGSVSTRLHRIAELARKAPTMVIVTLAHHIDMAWMYEAYRQTRKDGAAGIDLVTAAEYAEDLETNLRSLLERFKSGTYYAPPVRRVQIPKGNGRKTRPIGIPTFEDKILQRAVLMVLEAVYEQDFYDFSYGFRSRRSAHDALDSLWHRLTEVRGGWVLEADISSFFEVLDHKILRSFLDQRVRDGVIRKMIDKWLKAGVLEDGQLRRAADGTPQGGVISPLLANIYLHEVLDRWFVEQVQPRMRSHAHLIRYADDFVIVFADESDARRVMEVLGKRFGKYGLALHPEKTRLIDYRWPPGSGKGGGGGKPPTFDFLGFTHYWGRSRKGKPVVKRKTARGRLARSLKRVDLWCRRNRHKPVAEQHLYLSAVLRGHYSYYGVTGNNWSLGEYWHQLKRIWHYWLRRRSQRRSLTWARFSRLLKSSPLPSPKIVHSIYRRAANPCA
ncbi:MAG: group II intron reverse transcriptase/maturase [Candidatus Sulfomarinibacteraceae bacterium]